MTLQEISMNMEKVLEKLSDMEKRLRELEDKKKKRSE